MIKFRRIATDLSVCEISHPLMCEFGLISGPLIALITDFLATDLAVGPITAGIAGTIGAGALEGGAIGAITDPKNPLKGAEAGAITGGIGSAVSPFVGDLGLGSTATAGISGAIGGVAGAAATGGNIGQSALIGGVGGAATSAIGGAINGSAPSSTDAGATATPATAAPVTGGPGGSAGSVAAPASIGTGGAPAPAEGLGDVASLDSALGSPPSVNTGGTAGSGISGAPSPSIGGPSPGIGTTATSPAAAATGIGNAPAGTVTAPSVNTNIGTSDLSGATPALSGAASATPAAVSIGGGAVPTGSGIGSFIKDNAWLLPAAGLAYEATAGQAALPGQAALSTSATNLSAQANQLQNYFTSGTLPPGIQSGITQASDAAKAAIRSQYASMENTGSSAEAQDLAAVDSRATTQGSQIALSLLQQGVSEQGMANQLYMELMNTSLTQDAQLGSSIAAFSSALVPRVVVNAAAG